MVTNSDKAKSSSFLTIEMATTSSGITSFELMKGHYQTIGFEESQPFEVHIGSFGRQIDGSLKLAGNSNVFCFAIHGEVEDKDRLLSAGDSLYPKKLQPNQNRIFRRKLRFVGTGGKGRLTK